MAIRPPVGDMIKPFAVVLFTFIVRAPNNLSWAIIHTTNVPQPGGTSAGVARRGPIRSGLDRASNSPLCPPATLQLTKTVSTLQPLL